MDEFLRSGRRLGLIFLLNIYNICIEIYIESELWGWGKRSIFGSVSGFSGASTEMQST